MVDILTDKQYLDCFNLVFDKVHSDGFKIAEIKDLLYSDNYWFESQPIYNWKENLTKYLTNLDYNINLINILK